MSEEQKKEQNQEQQTERKLNVYQKIIEVKKCVKSFFKDSATSGSGAYKYTSGAQILSEIKAKMEEVGLLLLPVRTEHRGWTTYDYTTSYGGKKTDFIVEGKLVYEWINADDPNDRQQVEFEYYGQQNDISKAFGSALTYSERYLLLKSLGAPTDEDDPDKVTEAKTSTRPETSRRKAITTQNGQPKQEALQEQPQQPEQQRQGGQPKSQYKQVNELIRNTAITMGSIKSWIIKYFGSDIKINDLSEVQFNGLMAALKRQIERNAQRAEEEGSDE